MEEFVISGSINDSVSAGTFDTAYTDSSILLGTDLINQIIISDGVSAVTELWAHGVATCGTPTTATTRFGIVFSDSTGLPIARLQGNGGWRLGNLQYWDGSAWVTIASGFNIIVVGGNTGTWDMQVILNGASSYVAFYLDGNLMADGTVSIGSSGIFGNVAFGPAGTIPYYISQVIVADQSTIGMKYYCKAANADGSKTGFTGSYADIDEPVLGADYIYAATAGLESSFKAEVRNFTGFQVAHVQVTTSAKRGAAGPSKLQHGIGTGGTMNYGSSKTLKFGFDGSKTVFTTNPATGLAWTNADAESVNLEFGVKSIT